MRVVLCTVGSRGDVQPLLVLAREFVSRGHEILFAAPPNFREFIETEGHRFLPVGSDTHDVLLAHKQLTEKSPLSALPAQLALVRQETTRQFDDLLTHPPSADLVISAGLGFAGSALADRVGARYSYVCYTLSGIRSADHPPATLPLFGMPHFLNRLLWSLNHKSFDATLGKTIRELRKKHGLDEEDSPWRRIHTTHPLLAQDALLGRLPKDAWGAPVQVPALIDCTTPPAPLPSEVTDFLASTRSNTSHSRSPAVYVGFGSMPSADRTRVVSAVLQAQKRSKRPFLLFSAHDEDHGRALPPEILSVGSLDHRSLFLQVSAVVHHGGAGTTATALRAGTPQVIVPHIVDQFFHGKRIHELGLGPKPFAKGAFSADGLLYAIEQIDRHQSRARSVAQKLSGESGARDAVDFFERIV